MKILPTRLPDEIEENLTFRRVEVEDLSALEWDGEYQHFRRLYAETFQASLMGRVLLWVADLKPIGIIGQVFIQLNSGRKELANGINRAYLYGFRIKPAYRRQGIGTWMMAQAEADLVERGYFWITLNVGRDNPDARRLYERLGYQVVANEPGHWSYIDDRGNWQEVNEPAWRMEKRLDVKDG